VCRIKHDHRAAMGRGLLWSRLRRRGLLRHTLLWRDVRRSLHWLL